MNDNIVSIFQSLANPIRVSVVRALMENREMNVSDIYSHVTQEGAKITQGGLSQHLAKLREAGVVSTRRASTTIYYSLCGDELHSIFKAFKPVRRAILASKSGTMQGVEIIKETAHTYSVRNWSESKIYKVSKKEPRYKMFVAGTYKPGDIEQWIKA